MILDTNSAGKKGRRHEERSFRRKLILQAAERVFCHHPFHEATMQMVAAEAELGMQGVYEHFPSKQKLYEEVILHRAQSFRLRIGEATEGLDGPLEKLRAVARIRFEAFLEAPAFLPVFLAELLRYNWDIKSRMAPAVHRVFREVQAGLETILNQAIEAGLLRPLNPLFLQNNFMDVINGVILNPGKGSQGTADLQKEDIPRCVNLVMETFLNGVGAHIAS